MTRIICLANSFRPGGRCIAGIDVDTGRWVRPISKSIDRAITFEARAIEGREPNILEVLEIPLENDGPDEGCQPENRLLKQGKWIKVDQKEPNELLPYCESNSVILHNHEDRVPAIYFDTLSRDQWKSLQLIRSKDVSFHVDPFDKMRAYFCDGEGYQLSLKVTDPVFLNRLNEKKDVSRDCIMTISLAAPWSPDDIQPLKCYKLVAGVIEL